MNITDLNSPVPGCDVYELMGGRLHQPSPLAQAVLIFIIIINILTFPFTVVLNALVMVAVKVKYRLRSQKSNILIALLASTDFAVGVIIQPAFIALVIVVLLDETTDGACVLQFITRTAMSSLVDVSLIHLALISGERYLAMKHPFAHITLLTDSRLLVSSALAWLLNVILHIPLVVDKTEYFSIDNAIICLSIAFIVFCHATVFHETRRHSKLQINKFHKRQENNFEEIEKPLN